MTLQKFQRVILFLGILTFTMNGCKSAEEARGGQSPGTAPEEPASANNSSTPPPEINPEPGAQAVYAKGWKELEMIANWAKTKIDLAGHFSTSRNACGKEENGALELSIWNSLAENLNAAIKDEPLPEDYCLKLPDGIPGERYRVMDGTAELFLENGTKRALFETRGPEVCTRIANREAAAKILDELHKVVVIADQEGCPNGWGSGLY